MDPSNNTLYGNVLYVIETTQIPVKEYGPLGNVFFLAA